MFSLCETGTLLVHFSMSFWYNLKLWASELFVHITSMLKYIAYWHFCILYLALYPNCEERYESGNQQAGFQCFSSVTWAQTLMMPGGYTHDPWKTPGTSLGIWNPRKTLCNEPTCHLSGSWISYQEWDSSFRAYSQNLVFHAGDVYM